MTVNRLAPAVLLAVILPCGTARSWAQEPGHDHPLGTVDFPVSCSEPARREFDRAVALLHHMTYPRAAEAFQQVA